MEPETVDELLKKLKSVVAEIERRLGPVPDQPERTPVVITTQDIAYALSGGRDGAPNGATLVRWGNNDVGVVWRPDMGEVQARALIEKAAGHEVLVLLPAGEVARPRLGQEPMA